jgi:hypothetical protein
MEQLGERLAGTAFTTDSALLNEAVNRLEFDKAKVMASQLAKLLTGPPLCGSVSKL